jgi:hypothetical protein
MSEFASTTNELNTNEKQEIPTPESPSAFDDAVSFFDRLTDENEEGIDRSRAQESEADNEGAPVTPDTFFGYPIAVRGFHAIELAGNWSDDFLNRETVVMRAPQAMWGAESEWKHPHKGHVGWIPQRVTWRELITYFDDPYVSPNKNGHMIMFGEVAPEAGQNTIARKKANVKRINAVPFDLDAGQPQDEIFPPLLKSGLNFAYYTSHSNGKTRTKIDLKALREFVKVPVGTAYNPALDDVKGYLAEELKLHPTIVESASIVKVDAIGAFDDKPSNDPLQVEIAHAPIHKCRIILPLANEYVIPDDPDEALAAMNDFKAIVDHLAAEFGFWFDSTSGQVGRAFYGARCKSYDTYRAVIGGSSLLVLPTCTDEMRKAAGFKNQEKRKKALEQRRARRGDKQLDGVPDMTTFMRRHADDFDGIGWLKDIGWEMRGEIRGGKVSIRCPNETLHTKKKKGEKDVGCVAINPGSQYKNGEFLITCQHEHCEHFETRDFLTMICEEVIESTIDSDLPALENFVTEEAEADNGAVGSSTRKGKPSRAKLKKLLGKKPFAVNKYDWIEYDEIQKNGDVKTYPVCQAFDVLDMARDESGEGWSLRVKFDDYDGREHVARIALSDIHKSNCDLRPRLADMGLAISPLGKGFNALFARLVAVKERSIIVRKPGWLPNKRKFITPDGTMIGPDDGEGIDLENKLSGQRGGTLEGQLAAWEIGLRYGGPQYLIAALGGVGGAIVQFANLDSSCVVNLSGLSSRGKTTGLMIAAGGFGWPKMLKNGASDGGLLHSMRSTDNAIEFLAARSNGTFLGLDETAHINPADLEKIIFMIAGGVGKQRMRSDTSERKGKDWSTFTITSSEHVLTKLVERTGQVARVGFSARVADIDVSNAPMIPNDEYARMVALLSANYGHVGPALVEHLIKSGSSPESVSAAIEAKAKELAGKDASALVKRSAGVFAVLWQVGQLLDEAGLLPPVLSEIEGEGGRRVRGLWEAYRSSAEAEALSPLAKAIDTIEATLRARIGNDVHPTTKNAERKVRETVAWYIASEDSTDAFPEEPTFFYVRQGELAKLAGDTLPAGALCDALEEAGILKQTNKGKRPHRRVPDVGAVWHYRLDFSARVSGDDD